MKEVFPFIISSEEKKVFKSLPNEEKRGKFIEAIKYFEDFLRLEPDSPEAGGVKEMIEELKKQKGQIDQRDRKAA